MLSSRSRGNAARTSGLAVRLRTGGRLRGRVFVSLWRKRVERNVSSGAARVYGKRNKYRNVSLNSSAWETLQLYGATLDGHAQAQPRLVPIR